MGGCYSVQTQSSYMNYKTSGEFVKAHSNKIDEISELFDPKIFRAKDEVQRLSMAGIDFPLIDEGMDEPHEREGESGFGDVPLFIQ